MADYSISAIIRNDKPIKRNNRYPIYLRIRVYNRETKVPTNLEVAPSDWNAKKKEPREQTLRSALASKILAIEAFLNTCIASNTAISIDSVKQHLSESNPRRKTSFSGTFYDY